MEGSFEEPMGREHLQKLWQKYKLEHFEDRKQEHKSGLHGKLVNLVDWLKMMVGSMRSEEVVDPTIETKPSIRALKRALLTAIRCVDPDSDKRPKMSQVVGMLESEEYPLPREDRRHRSQASSTKIESSQRENYDTDKSDNPNLCSDSSRRNLKS